MLKKLPLLLALFLSSVIPGWAQRFELQPFVGLKTGGNFPVMCNLCSADLTFSKISLESNINYGATFGLNANDNVGIEFMWNRLPTNAVGRLSTGNSPQKVDINVDQYHGNFVFTFFEKERKFRPFILAGVGATKLKAGGESDWRISYGVGGGVKYFFSPHMGVRLQARYSPTFLYATTDGAWCNWWGVCYATNSGHYLQQFDMTAGWVFRF